jgi:hypothetical protein
MHNPPVKHRLRGNDQLARRDAMHDQKKKELSLTTDRPGPSRQRRSPSRRELPATDNATLFHTLAGLDLHASVPELAMIRAVDP